MRAADLFQHGGGLVQCAGSGHGYKEMLFTLAGGGNSGIAKLGYSEGPGDRYANDLWIRELQPMGQRDEAVGDPELTRGGISV
ncbi:MAG: hypothetical protein V3V08_12595 [Nannocystaceae bacterium]